MGHRINERNIGNSTLDGMPKKRGQKLKLDEYSVVRLILEKVYDAMEYDETTSTYTDGGRITLSLTCDQVYDLFEAKRKVNAQFENEKKL